MYYSCLICKNTSNETVTTCKQVGFQIPSKLVCPNTNSGWESSHGSGTTLAMHRRLNGIATYGLNGPEKGDEPALSNGARQFTFQVNLG